VTPKRRPKRKTVRVRVPRVGTVRQARVSQVGRVARVSGRSSSASCSRADLSARQRARAMRADSVLWRFSPDQKHGRSRAREAQKRGNRPQSSALAGLSDARGLRSVTRFIFTETLLFITKVQVTALPNRTNRTKVPKMTASPLFSPRLCQICSQPLPYRPNGRGRGRPRKVHVECRAEANRRAVARRRASSVLAHLAASPAPRSWKFPGPNPGVPR
jgi:hypothetical protein